MSLYTYVAGFMTAETEGHAPIFKGEVHDLITLHKSKPSLQPTDLERLAREISSTDGTPLPPGFRTAEEIVRAAPEWETADESYHPPRSRKRPKDEGPLTPDQERMDFYNRLRKAGLAETTDNQDLFWTVMDSIDGPSNDHGVRLTELGKYYWDLANRGQINMVGD